MSIDWDTARVRIHSAGRVRCEPGWSLDRPWSRRLSDLDLWYVWAGRGSMVLGGGQAIALRPGVCLWMRPGRTYLAEQDLEHRLGVTFIHFDVLDAVGRPIIDDAALPPEVHEVTDVVYGDAVLRRVGELSQHHDQPAAAAHLLTGFLMELDAGVGAVDSGGAPGARRRSGAGGTADHHRRLALAAAARIRESPSEAPDVATLAADAGYSADHFARIFRTVLGQSPQDFVVQARIDRAKQLLSESSLTVSQIADVLGYRDVYFFSRQFKQRTGRSPTDHRHRS